MIKDRRDFGQYCQERKYTRGIEIGTDRADFAHNVLRQWPSCEEFWCFDPYESYGDGSHDHPYDRTPDLMMACIRLAPFVPAVRIIRQCSRAWPQRLWFRPDFVYVDGLHDFANVAADIDAWWPCIVPGGTLAGHDYSESTPDVIRVVDAFVKREGLPLHLTAEPRFPRSWWVVKP